MFSISFPESSKLKQEDKNISIQNAQSAQDNYTLVKFNKCAKLNLAFTFLCH